MTHILIPREPSTALLRPFIGCNTQELHEAWAAMVRIAEVQHARAGSQRPAQIEQPATLAGTTIEQYARMFNAACEALGQVSDCLGINSDINPGAEPIIAAIKQLRAGGPPVFDGCWKARILDGRAIERDAQGLGEHPDLPWLEEGMNPPKFFEALGLQLVGVSAQDQLDVDAYDAMAGNYDAKEFNFAAWAPASPEGTGWCLVSIHDTEDGPVAWWLREQPYVAATRPVRRARERDDLTAEECREYLRSGWARVRGRTEQALMLQLCEALEAGASPAPVAGPAGSEIDWDVLPENPGERARFDHQLSQLYGGDPRVFIATSLRLWAETRGSGFFGAQCAVFANEVAKMHIAAPVLEAPAVPTSAASNGWRLVPTGRATTAMVLAASHAHVLPGASYSDLWTAMLAAAPQAPAGLDELRKISEIAACWGCDHPDEPGDTEVVRRVKWAARQLRAASQAPAAPAADVISDGEFFEMAVAAGASRGPKQSATKPPVFPTWGAWGRFCDSVRAAPAAPAVDAETIEDAARFRAIANAGLTDDEAFDRALEKYPELGGDATIDDVRAMFDAARAAVAAQAKEGGEAC